MPLSGGRRSGDDDRVLILIQLVVYAVAITLLTLLGRLADELTRSVVHADIEPRPTRQSSRAEQSSR